MSAYHPFAHVSQHSFPTHCTYNTRGLSAKAHTSDKRRSRKRFNIEQLASKFGVLCLQETRLAHDHLYLGAIAPYVNYSSHTSGSAGVAILVDKSTLTHYSATSIALPASLQGYFAATLLTPTDHVRRCTHPVY